MTKTYEVEYTIGEADVTYSQYTDKENAEKDAAKINAEWTGDEDEPHNARVIEIE